MKKISFMILMTLVLSSCFSSNEDKTQTPISPENTTANEANQIDPVETTDKETIEEKEIIDNSSETQKDSNNNTTESNEDNSTPVSTNEEENQNEDINEEEEALGEEIEILIDDIINSVEDEK